jgi:hypothetical protein
LAPFDPLTEIVPTIFAKPLQAITVIPPTFKSQEEGVIVVETGTVKDEY